MAPALNITKMDSTAGLVALSATESYHISPHTMLVERERAHIASMLEKSFVGLAEICGKAASAVSAFQELKEVLNEGKGYFFPTGTISFEHTHPHTHGSQPSTPSVEKIFSVRRGIYALGKMEGFEKILRQTRRNMTPTVVLEGDVFERRDVEEMILYCQRLEARRMEHLHKLSSALDACVQVLSKNKHLQNTLCALGGMPDAEQFTKGRREERRRSTEQLFTWNDHATTAHAAFCPELTFEGWLQNLAKLKDSFPPSVQTWAPSSVKLAGALSPERKQAFAQRVVEVLDDIAFLARKHTTIPDSPVKDIFRIHFLLCELEKELPQELAEEHSRCLAAVTHRFLQHRDSTVYILGIECDNLLPDNEKALLLRHFAQSQPTPSATPPAAEPPHIAQERRTKVRRELKESLEHDRMRQQVEEVLGRIQELKESAPS